ncbi:MAG: SDR family NAD(P)-dependent oxidoreductase, partial [Clostridia bacterium]
LNNSGVGVLSNVIEMDVKSQINMCDVNVKALTAVTTVVLPYMVKGGTIINISSIASFAPTPKMTVYSATKAYVSAYSRGLNYELKDRGVNVLAICPGPMDTEFLSVAGITQKGSKTFDTLPHTKVEFVVRGAIKAAKKGKAFYTPKLIFKIYRVLAKLLPHALIVKFSKC